MTSALIGHTGFVGSNLRLQGDFQATFNSHNIEAIRGSYFDEIVCAGVPAVKWLANKEPEADWQNICRLMSCLEQASAGHFTLISTIDVYRNPIGFTEMDTPVTEGLHAYGRHRLALEEFVAKRFPLHGIVRLPALFGSGLKKNALFDLMNRNMTDLIAPGATFQWYPLRRLYADLDIVRRAKVKLINVTAEPISMGDIRDRFFSDVPIGDRASISPHYNLRSIHDLLLGGHNGYHLDATAVWNEMAMFLGRPS